MAYCTALPVSSPVSGHMHVIATKQNVGISCDLLLLLFYDERPMFTLAPSYGLVNLHAILTLLTPGSETGVSTTCADCGHSLSC
jgi:hypothetical protein